MTPTAYIVTPISTPPEKDGHYQMACENGVPVGHSFEFAEGEWIQNSPKIWFWLRRVDLSMMLEEAWDAGSRQVLKDIAKTFLKPSNQDKADKRTDKDVFQAIGETIQSFPLDELAKQSYLSSINKEK